MKQFFITSAAIAAVLIACSPIAKAQDTPPSSIEKEGYRLIFNDEFDGTTLDPEKWVDSYFETRDYGDGKSNKAVYEMKNGTVKLIIEKNSPELELSPNYCMTGFMTSNGASPGSHVQGTIPTKPHSTHLNQYGYYEMRAKMQRGSGVHTAWWLVGAGDQKSHSSEMDIFEVLGASPSSVMTTFHPWKDSSVVYHTQYPNFQDRKLDEEFHIYSFEWTADSLFVSVDGLRIYAHSAAINYPMHQIISFYDNRNPDGWTGAYDPSVEYPKTFEVDYVRVYKKIPEGFSSVQESDLAITKIEPARYNITINDEVKNGSLQIVSPTAGANGRGIVGMPSYVNVHYNDGTITQQFVKWSEVSEASEQRLLGGGVVVIDGEIMGLSSALLQGRRAEMVLRGVVESKEQ